MITVDVDRSTVTIAGQTFPAVAAVFDEPAEMSEYDRTLGDYLDSRRYQLTLIPSENGILIALAWEMESERIEVVVHAPTTERTREIGGETIVTLPILCVDGGTIMSWPPRERLSRRMVWEWKSDDHEWVAEHVARLGRLTVEQIVPPAERVRLVPLHSTAPRSMRDQKPMQSWRSLGVS